MRVERTNEKYSRADEKHTTARLQAVTNLSSTPARWFVCPNCRGEFSTEPGEVCDWCVGKPMPTRAVD